MRESANGLVGHNWPTPTSQHVSPRYYTRAEKGIGLPAGSPTQWPALWPTVAGCEPTVNSDTPWGPSPVGLQAQRLELLNFSTREYSSFLHQSETCSTTVHCCTIVKYHNTRLRNEPALNAPHSSYVWVRVSRIIPNLDTTIQAAMSTKYPCGSAESARARVYKNPASASEV